MFLEACTSASWVAGRVALCPDHISSLCQIFPIVPLVFLPLAPGLVARFCMARSSLTAPRAAWSPSENQQEKASKLLSKGC